MLASAGRTLQNWLGRSMKEADALSGAIFRKMMFAKTEKQPPPNPKFDDDCLKNYIYALELHPERGGIVHEQDCGL
jgi:hypothetical protein